jgi:hypothetical protein
MSPENNGKTLKKRTLYRHPLAALGGALMVAGAIAFVILVAMDISASTDNPYRALVTFVAAPAIVTLGFVLFMLAIWIQVRRARKRGERVRFNLSIDPTDPNYMRNLWLFLGFSAVLIAVIAFSGTEAYESTESVAFCGETCHEVMNPQAVTYKNSPHARVACVACHIGPGASFWVKSKIDGTRQVIAATFNTFSRPIETPIANLRPAQETCEQCHWPRQFYGKKLIARTYYRTDEENSPWTINLLMKIGGGNPRTGAQEGIHWHMLIDNRIDYIATDEKRMDIVWVRQISHTGDTTIYTDPDADEIPDPNDPNVEVRRFDCMDCHNRPSHNFEPPATSLNLALSNRELSPQLPYIREEGLELLNAEYANRPEAHQAIRSGLLAYYKDEYPDLVDSMSAEIQQATATLLNIYDNNFFPDMKTDYRARENDLSHFVNDGCFRCHDNMMESEDGKIIGKDCKTCHLIVAQGPSEHLDSLEQNIAGLEFHHPEDIGGAWEELKCTECHDQESGY